MQHSLTECLLHTRTSRSRCECSSRWEHNISRKTTASLRCTCGILWPWNLGCNILRVPWKRNYELILLYYFPHRAEDNVWRTHVRYADFCADLQKSCIICGTTFSMNSGHDCCTVTCCCCMTSLKCQFPPLSTIRAKTLSYNCCIHLYIGVHITEMCSS